MIDIGVFGCSYTSLGRPETWPVYLVEKNPNANVWDFSQNGTSIEYSIGHMVQFKKDYPHAKVIFQITKPARITYAESKLQIDHQQDRYISYNRKVRVWTPGQPDYKLRKIYEAVQRYAQPEMIQIVYDSLIYRIQKEADFCFFHTSTVDASDRFLEIPCIETICDNFNSFCKKHPIDDHFTPQGHMWIADWINSKVQTWN